MKTTRSFLSSVICLLAGFISICTSSSLAQTRRVDVLVIGGGTGGTAAGIQAARSGAQTLIVEPTPWLGGMMTAAGVSAIDGNHLLPSGLWAEFRDQLYKVYGGPNRVATGWVSNTLFEPHVGDSIFKSMAARESMLRVLHGYVLTDMLKHGDRIEGARFLDQTTGKSLTVRAGQVIDATELGDAIALSGIPFDVGMEANAATGEDIFVAASNDIIQDLTYAAILKDYGPAVDCTIVRPKNYDPHEFDGSCTDFYQDKSRIPPNVDSKKMILYGKLPNRKYMINWPAYGNDIYLNLIDRSSKQRLVDLDSAKQQTLRFIYFMQQELGFKNLGLANDEFPTSDRLPLIPYNREGRRMHGLARFKIQHIARPFREDEPLYRTAISVGDYPVDQHHRKNPIAPQHLSFYAVPSFSVPLGALIPSTLTGILAAEKAISVSNIVNGATRLQPCVLLTGQAVGLLAAKAALSGRSAAEVPIREVQQALLEAKAYLMPYADITPDHPHFISVQRIGATGILRGRLQPSGWANRTWFDGDSTMKWGQLWPGLEPYLISQPDRKSEAVVTGKELLWVLEQFLHVAPSIERLRSIYAQAGFPEWEVDRPLRRIELAVVLDRWVDPFQLWAVDHQGKLVPKK